jgi:hypothetical protein
MSLADEAIYTLNEYNKIILFDISELSTLPLTAIQMNSIYNNILNYQSSINSIKYRLNLFAMIYGQSVADKVNAALTEPTANLIILMNGFECAKKNIVPDANGSCSATASISVPKTKPGPPPRQEIALKNAPSAVYTVGNRESFSNINITNMPIIEGLAGFDENLADGGNSMNSEMKLANDLMDFNIKYQRYLQCNDPKYQGNNSCSTTEMSTCKDADGSSNCLYTQINNYAGTPGQIGILQTDIQNVSNYLNTATLSPSEYESKYQQILANQKRVLELRNELDIKLMELHNPEKSVLADYKKNYDSTVYSGILMTALATSVIYYIFTEL